MELSSSNIKKNSFFSQKKDVLIISQKKVFPVSRNGTLHFSAQGLQNKKICPEKIVYTSGNKNHEKNSYISYYILIFKEMELLSPKFKIF